MLYGTHSHTHAEVLAEPQDPHRTAQEAQMAHYGSTGWAEKGPAQMPIALPNEDGNIYFPVDRWGM